MNLRVVTETGDPNPRCVCVNCSKPFRVFQVKNPRWPTRNDLIHRSDPRGYFCTLNCAAAYGLSCAHVGIRLIEAVKI